MFYWRRKRGCQRDQSEMQRRDMHILRAKISSEILPRDCASLPRSMMSACQSARFILFAPRLNLASVLVRVEHLLFRRFQNRLITIRGGPLCRRYGRPSCESANRADFSRVEKESKRGWEKGREGANEFAEQECRVRGNVLHDADEDTGA